MAKRGDEAKVGLVVLMVGTILIATVFTMLHYNPFQLTRDDYKIRLKFAGGLEKDGIVRFGGMKRGKVTGVRLASDSTSVIEVDISLQKGTPVRQGSVARLASLNALGENYIEISPGPDTSPILQPGQLIPSEETPAFSELLAKMSALSEDAKRLITDLDRNLNRISDSADTLLANLNEITGPSNRQILSSALENANGALANANNLITRNGPKIDAIASNLQTTSEKMPPLMERVNETTQKVNTLIEHLDATVVENRPQLKKDIETLESALTDARKLMADFSVILENNRDDIDAILENFRRSSENLQEFSRIIKERPYSMIRVKGSPDRKVPK
jgi:phospholipid/cholesterol/gamma-HCH transport system substrate-binding protein